MMFKMNKNKFALEIIDYSSGSDSNSINGLALSEEERTRLDLLGSLAVPTASGQAFCCTWLMPRRKCASSRSGASARNWM